MRGSGFRSVDDQGRRRESVLFFGGGGGGGFSRVGEHARFAGRWEKGRKEKASELSEFKSSKPSSESISSFLLSTTSNAQSRLSRTSSCLITTFSRRSQLSSTSPKSLAPTAHLPSLRPLPSSPSSFHHVRRLCFPKDQHRVRLIPSPPFPLSPTLLTLLFVVRDVLQRLRRRCPSRLGVVRP